MKASVIKAHRSTYPHPIRFNNGDRVSIGRLDQEYPGWVWVELSDGNAGWAPLEYLDIDRDGNTARAGSDYCARELDINPGERLQIIEALCGWKRVSRASGESGWVPADCLQPD